MFGVRSFAWRIGSLLLAPARSLPPRALRPARGQAIVELAFILTMLLMLSIGAFEYGGILQAHNVVVQAAREGARRGMDITATDAVIEAAARTAALPNTLSPGNVGATAGVEIVHPSGTELRVTTRTQYVSGVWFIGTVTMGSSMDTRRW